MKWHKIKRVKNWQMENINIRGGFEKQKAKQNRLVFYFSTKNEQITTIITDCFNKVNVGIDSS